MCTLQMVVQMPSLLCSLSLEDTLKPRLELLQQDIGLPAEALPGIIARRALHPCIKLSALLQEQAAAGEGNSAWA